MFKAVAKRKDALRLAHFALSRDGFRLLPDAPRHEHLGALLADSALQAGLNYRSVVFPRVSRILEMYPDAHSMAGLRDTLSAVTSRNFLSWSHDEKIRRFDSLVSTFDDKVESVAELCEWMECDRNRAHLLTLRGVGNKTVDYLYRLSGGEEIAVDRHLFRFLEVAGLECGDYGEAKKMIGQAADLLGVSKDAFDASIWKYMSDTRQIRGRAA